MTGIFSSFQLANRVYGYEADVRPINGQVGQRFAVHGRFDVQQFANRTLRSNEFVVRVCDMHLQATSLERAVVN